jgi:hypothetical protein
MEPRPIVFKEWRDTRTFSNLKSTHCTLLILLIINLFINFITVFTVFRLLTDLSDYILMSFDFPFVRLFGVLGNFVITLIY